MSGGGRPRGRVPVGWWLVVSAGLLTLVLVAGLALLWPWQPGEPSQAQFSPTPEPAPGAVLAGLVDSEAPAPTAEGVHAAVDDLLRSQELGPGVSAAVVDPLTGQQLYGRDPAAPTVPASATKLLTAATVLSVRGPAYRLDTVAVAGAQPGEVVLVGGGDPTLAIDEEGFYPGSARLDVLAQQVREAMGDTPVGKVTVDASLFEGPAHGPWTDDIVTGGYVSAITALMTDGGRVDPDPAQEQRPVPRWPAPDLAAGEAFAQLLGAPADAVERGAAPSPANGQPATPGPGDPARGSGGPPGQPDPSPQPAQDRLPGPAAGPLPAGTELGRVSSPPLLRLVEYMLVTSDNVLAEGLARQVALARGEPASYAGAATAIEKVLADLGVPPGSGFRLADGSGLSRDNQFTAELLTDLLSAAVVGPAAGELAGLVAGLPVAGWSGTLADRYRPGGESGAEPGDGPGPGPGAGMVRAKTGSLTGVNALAGMVVTADGRLLVFALLTDEVPVGQERARELLDQAAAALAGCGCR